MAIPFKYTDLAKRLSEIRAWAGDITEGNRCAVVIGQALKLKPGQGDTTFKGQPSAQDNVKNQPFMDKFFVKAADLAVQITKTYGPPDERLSGKEALEKLNGSKGVVYLHNCWRTPSEKVKGWVGLKSKKTGDHIDLWDGSVIEIYRGHEGANHLVSASERVLFWKAP